MGIFSEKKKSSLEPYDIDAFMNKCRKLSLPQREKLYIWFTVAIAKHFDVNRSRTLLSLLNSVFVEDILPEHKSNINFDALIKKHSDSGLFKGLNDDFWDCNLTLMACLLTVALHFGHIRDSGFPFGIGGYFLRYAELAEKEGKYQIEDNQAFFDKFKLIGRQLVLSLDESMKIF